MLIATSNEEDVELELDEDPEAEFTELTRYMVAKFGEMQNKCRFVGLVSHESSRDITTGHGRS